jgi:hypothetical protein
MPNTAEIRRSLEGAWLLARLDPTAMSHFDLSVEGFWRSFFAAVVAAPPYMLLVANQYSNTGAGAHIGVVVFVEVLSYILSWLAFPVLAAFATKLLGLSHRYVALVVATNWAAVLQVTLLAGTMLLTGLLPEGHRSFLALAATLAAVTYQWLVIKTSLETTGSVAFALVIADVLVAVLVNMGTASLIQEG